MYFLRNTIHKYNQICRACPSICGKKITSLKILPQITASMLQKFPNFDWFREFCHKTIIVTCHFPRNIKITDCLIK